MKAVVKAFHKGSVSLSDHSTLVPSQCSRIGAATRLAYQGPRGAHRLHYKVSGAQVYEQEWAGLPHKNAPLKAAGGHLLETMEIPINQHPLEADSSHTFITVPLTSVELYGNYCICGPAVIRKVNQHLIAIVSPGGHVDLLKGTDVHKFTQAMLSHDEDVAATCTLLGEHVQVDGDFILKDPAGTMQHHGKVIVNVSHFPANNYIRLGPGGQLSHPVNVQPCESWM